MSALFDLLLRSNFRCGRMPYSRKPKRSGVAAAGPARQKAALC